MRRAIRILSGLALLALGLLLAVGYANAVRAPVVTRATLAVPGLPPGTRLTVAFLSDTHRGFPDMPGGRLARVVSQVNALNADAIVLAGDYSGGKPLEKLGERATYMSEAVGPFAKLRAPLGVYMVGGNHDSARWLAWWAARNPNPRLLANSHVDLGPLVLGGSLDATSGPDPQATFAGAPRKPRVFVIHEPDMLRWIDPHADLTLSGHTHGGQIMLPGGRSATEVVTGERFPCRRGACVVNGHRVFVTSGVGTSQLPMRFGVPPEIALLTLVPG